MKLTIDNLDQQGPRDYTNALAAAPALHLKRRLNQPSELQSTLISNGPGFMVPELGGKMQLTKSDGSFMFTGYITEAPEFEYLGWGEQGPGYRYRVVALSDEAVLDRKTLPTRSPFVARAAGGILKQLTQDLLPGSFDLGGISDMDLIAWYRSDPQKTWSEHAAELCVLARASYRVLNAQIFFAAVGTPLRTLDEASPLSSPGSLKVKAGDVINDVIVVGDTEPQDYVKDYFVGDGFTLHFNLSQKPFTRFDSGLVDHRLAPVLLDEEYPGAALRLEWWSQADPTSAVSVVGGALVIAGGTGADGQTTISFVEKVELGGAVVLVHGDVTFSGASNGVLGGLYAGAITAGGCLAGFHVAPSGTQSVIQALINGAAVGSTVVTQSGHQYSLTTRLFAPGTYRQQQGFHSAQHTAGNERGGATVAADVRMVLELHDEDPANPGTFATPSTVLYDGVIAGASGFCTYALVNAAAMHCSITFTRILRVSDAVIRSAIPGQSYRTRLTGSQIDGAECHITSEPALLFYAANPPVSNEQIEVTYRSRGRAVARVQDPTSIAALGTGGFDGLRGAVRTLALPHAKTSDDCANAGSAFLDDSIGQAWTGQYETWSDFLPGGAADIFPGEGIQVTAPSRAANFTATVREVNVEILDPANDRSRYAIRFANDASESLAMKFMGNHSQHWSDLAILNRGVLATAPGDLSAAEITLVSSTTVTIDIGMTVPAGFAVEVRRSDSGWGPDNDRNLVGRFSTRIFTVTRLARVQNYYLRLYVVLSPTTFSRRSAALHLDYPL